jgi:hypothetical protein
MCKYFAPHTLGTCLREHGVNNQHEELTDKFEARQRMALVSLFWCRGFVSVWMQTARGALPRKGKPENSRSGLGKRTQPAANPSNALAPE